MSSVRPVRSLPITSAVRRANSIMMQVLRVGRLLQADEPIALVAQLVEHRRQRAMRFDFDGVGPIAGDLAVELGRAGANDPLEPAAAGRPGRSARD